MDILPSSPEFAFDHDTQWLKQHGIDPALVVTAETLETVLDKDVPVAIANPTARICVQGLLRSNPLSDEVVLAVSSPATNERFNWSWSRSSLGLDAKYRGEVQAHLYLLSESDK